VTRPQMHANCRCVTIEQASSVKARIWHRFDLAQFWSFVICSWPRAFLAWLGGAP
jgi:hypothetical protein